MREKKIFTIDDLVGSLVVIREELVVHILCTKKKTLLDQAMQKHVVIANSCFFLSLSLSLSPFSCYQLYLCYLKQSVVVNESDPRSNVHYLGSSENKA